MNFIVRLTLDDIIGWGLVVIILLIALVCFVIYLINQGINKLKRWWKKTIGKERNNNAAASDKQSQGLSDNKPDHLR